MTVPAPHYRRPPTGGSSGQYSGDVPYKPPPTYTPHDRAESGQLAFPFDVGVVSRKQFEETEQPRWAPLGKFPQQVTGQLPLFPHPLH